MPALSDVDDVVAAAGQVDDEVVGDVHVGTGGVDDGQALVNRALLHRRRHAVRRKDYRAVIDLLQTGYAVVKVDQLHAVLGQFVHDMGVVHEVTQHVDGSLVGGTSLVGEPDGIDHAVAKPAGCDTQNVHQAVRLSVGKAARTRMAQQRGAR